MDAISSVSRPLQWGMVGAGGSCLLLLLSRACHWTSGPDLPAASLLSKALTRVSEYAVASTVSAVATLTLSQQMETTQTPQPNTPEPSPIPLTFDRVELAAIIPSKATYKEVESLRAALNDEKELELADDIKVLLARIPQRMALAKEVIQWAETQPEEWQEDALAKLEIFGCEVAERFADLLSGNISPSEQSAFLEEIHHARATFLDHVIQLATQDGYNLSWKLNPLTQMARENPGLNGFKNITEEPSDDFECVLSVGWELYLLASKPLEPSDARLLELKKKLIERCDREVSEKFPNLQAFQADVYALIEQVSDLRSP